MSRSEFAINVLRLLPDAVRVTRSRRNSTPKSVKCKAVRTRIYLLKAVYQYLLLEQYYLVPLLLVMDSSIFKMPLITDDCWSADLFMDLVRLGDCKAVENILQQKLVRADDTTGVQTPLLVRGFSPKIGIIFKMQG